MKTPNSICNVNTYICRRVHIDRLVNENPTVLKSFWTVLMAFAKNQVSYSNDKKILRTNNPSGQGGKVK